MLMIDRHRSIRQAEKRDSDWTDVNAGEDGVSLEPSAERRMAAAQEAAQIFRLLNRLGPRTATAFRRHRVDGVAQKEIAVELGVSLRPAIGRASCGARVGQLVLISVGGGT